jgi:hypothetical protein
MSTRLDDDLQIQGTISYTLGTNLPVLVQPRFLYGGTAVFTTGSTTSYTISGNMYYAIIKSGLILPAGYNYFMITVCNGDYPAGGFNIIYTGTIRNNGNGTFTAGMTIFNIGGATNFRVDYSIYAII